MIIFNEWVNYIIPITIIIVFISNNYYVFCDHWLLPLSNVDEKRYYTKLDTQHVS